MASYGKSYRPQLTSLPKFDVSREMSVESSLTYASTFANHSHNATPTTSTFDDTIPIHQVPFPLSQINNNNSSAYVTRGPTPTVPQVVSYRPQIGSPGTQIHVHVTSLSEIYQSALPVFILEFGSTRVHASATQLEGRHAEFIITGKAPPVSMTEWQTSHTPMVLLLDDENGRQLSRTNIGLFEYEDCHSSPAIDSSDNDEHGLSSEAEGMRNIVAGQMTGSVKSEDGLSYCFPSTNMPQFYTGHGHNNVYSAMPDYNDPSLTYQDTTPTDRNLYQYTATTTAALPHRLSPSAWPSYPTVPQQRSNGTVGSNYMSRPILNALPPPMSTNPTLIRTTALSQQSSPRPSANHGSGYKYPFSSLTDSHRAQLHISGNLEAMANVCDWAPEELECKRRIVMFKRSQHGSKVIATFQPVIGEKPPQNSVCISCIFWKEKKDCFVTSVDTIYLLESLAGSKFPTDEKNRIRRNMEGYHPLTVSKGKADSEDFFKTIMGFPNPKPRNIEKDIKVFSWKILSGGLKKIIGKYTAALQPSHPPQPPILTPASSYGHESSSGQISHASFLGHNPHDIYQHSAYSSASSKRSLSGHSLDQSSAISRPISPEDVKSIYTTNNNLRQSTNSYYTQQQDHYPQSQLQTVSYMNPIPTPPARDNAWELGLASATYVDNYASNIDVNPRISSLPDYGACNTPIGVSIPKLLDINGQSNNM